MLFNVLSLYIVYCILTPQIFSIVHGVMHVTLNVRYRGTELNVNEELIRLNYADRAEEPYSSMVFMLFRVLLFFDYFLLTLDYLLFCFYVVMEHRCAFWLCKRVLFLLRHYVFGKFLRIASAVCIC